MGASSFDIEASVGHIVLVVGLLAVATAMPQFADLVDKLL